MVRIVLLAGADAPDIRIRRKCRICILWLNRGERAQEPFLRFEEQKPHGGPSRVNLVLLEQGQECRDDGAYPLQILSILVESSLVAHPPVKLEIQGNNKDAFC